MRTKLNLFLGVTLFALLFSCQKEANHDLSNDSGTAVENLSSTLGATTLTVTPLGCGGYMITGKKQGGSGSLELFDNGESVATSSTGNPRTLLHSVEFESGTTHNLKLVWSNPVGNTLQSQTVLLTVVDAGFLPDCGREPIECDGSVHLDASEVTAGAVCGTYRVQYTLSSCEAQEGLKLQGGLTANVVSTIGTGSSGLVSVPSLETGKKNTKNTNATHTWENISLEAGEAKSFWIEFSVSSKAFGGAGVDGLYPITGAWSVKKNSVLLAGYNNRIMVNKCTL
jgi:hypothetical protein